MKLTVEFTIANENGERLGEAPGYDKKYEHHKIILFKLLFPKANEWQRKNISFKNSS